MPLQNQPVAQTLPSEAFGLFADVPASGPLRPVLSNGLRSWPVADADGRIVATVHGLMLEGALGPGLSVDAGVLRAERPIKTAEDIERHVVRGLAGCLVVETAGGPFGRRLYPDCGASLAIVFCPELRQIGGSAGMILDDAAYRDRFLIARHERLVRAEGKAGWISGTLTAHRGVCRLLANHYLDLDNFTQHRFWPSASLLGQAPPTLEEAAQSVARHMRRFGAAAASRFHVAVALTAGLDSRLVLAAFRGQEQSLSAFTLADGHVSFDQDIPPRLCTTMGIRHQSVSIRRADATELARWDQLTGQALSSNNREIHPSLVDVEADVLVNGLYGEPARCFLYRHDWQQVYDREVDALNILARLKQPRDPEMEADIEAWLAPVRDLPRSTVMDLAYLELRMGSWAMGQGPIQKAMRWHLMPFAQWPIQEIFLTLTVADRCSDRLLPRIGEILWPEGMALPINRYGDWRDRLGPLNRLARVDSLTTLRRFLRKKLAR